MKKIGKQSIIFENVYLKATSIVGGKLEKEGPMSNYFDKLYDDNYCNCLSWEEAEIKLLEEAYNKLIEKTNLTKKQIGLYIGGDLNNQIAITNYFMRQNDTPFLGIYSACATSVEGLIIGSTYIDTKTFNNVVTSVSSHNSTSERQFRYPTEYGGQKPESTTFTSTIAGCALLSHEKTNIKITKATIGTVIDGGIKDPQDMGRAMAPSALMTLKQHLEDFNIKAEDYDLILTGDLSYYGSKVFKELLGKYNILLNDNYNDSGLMLYNRINQNVYAGGSGCGCIAGVAYGYIKSLFDKKEINKVLLIATGALLNPVMIAQKESIPSIAHAICLERSDIDELS